jgi:phosphohistidine phosphatase
MKRVIITRHAKAEPYGYDNDFNRDLTSRGVSDAEKVSRQLKEDHIIPDWVIASPAQRTMHTAWVFCAVLGLKEEEIQTEISFYKGLTTQGFIDLLSGMSDELHTILTVGHNPTVQYLVGNLTSHFYGEMPTCSTVVVDFQVESWKDLRARSGTVNCHIIPREL